MITPCCGIKSAGKCKGVVRDGSGLLTCGLASVIMTIYGFLFLHLPGLIFRFGLYKHICFKYTVVGQSFVNSASHFGL